MRTCGSASRAAERALRGACQPTMRTKSAIKKKITKQTISGRRRPTARRGPNEIETPIPGRIDHPNIPPKMEANTANSIFSRVPGKTTSGAIAPKRAKTRENFDSRTLSPIRSSVVRGKIRAVICSTKSANLSPLGWLRPGVMGSPGENGAW